MTSTTQRGKAATSSKSSFQHREGSGTLFYDVPGTPTLSGQIMQGKLVSVTGEPAVDKEQRPYIKIVGEGVSGALYENDRKEQEKHPDYTGPIDFNGQKLRMSAWKKLTKTGKNAGGEFLSVALSEKRTASE